MSLDVYLYDQTGIPGLNGTGIYVRENGQNREITRAEWNERFPGREPVMAVAEAREAVFSRNITHNLGRMALEVGLHDPLWCPENIGITHAWQLIAPMEAGLTLLRADPERIKAFNPANGWGCYENLVEFVEEYLTACKKWPGATIHASP